MVKGQTTEFMTLTVGLIELEARFADPKVIIVPPAQTSSFATGGLGEDHGGENEKWRAEIQAAEQVHFVASGVPWGGHYTLLTVSNVEGTRQAEYRDPLRGVSPTCKATASSVLRHLGVLEPEVPAPENHELGDYQCDNWSCGIHVRKWIEQALRKRRCEAPRPPPSLDDIVKRTNNFIAKIKTAMKKRGLDKETYAVVAKAKAEAKGCLLYTSPSPRDS